MECLLRGCFFIGEEMADCPKCDCCLASGSNEKGDPSLCYDCHFGLNKHKKWAKPNPNKKLKNR